ncbi:MAG TPA: restriction endonuclease subunit S, partial [Ilumatobacteraceae bacterium]|nr:restriction endonuclease subunit S [Ilumatobacteraceae bacterium]
DRLIAKQTALIDTLRERRTAAIHALTFSLPRVDFRPVKQVADVFIGKMLQPEQRSAEEVYAPYLRAAHVQPLGRLIDVDDKRMWFGVEELAAHDVRVGDVIVVEGGAGFGRSAVVREDLLGWGFQKSVIRIRAKPEHAVGAFIDYALQAALAIGTVEMAASTATIPHFTAEKVAVFPIPSPAVEEQRKIVEQLDEQTAKIDLLISKAERFVELARERRAALITAAVTGQIEVGERGAA